MDPLLMPKALPNMAAAQVSLQLGLKGYNATTVTACAAGTQAIGEAADLIRHGERTSCSAAAQRRDQPAGVGRFRSDARNVDPQRRT